MNKESKIFVAGHRGLVGSAIVRALQKEGFNNIILRAHKELDLAGQQAVHEFFAKERPEYVLLTPRKLLDTNKLNALGWKYSIQLEDGIASTYKWFKDNYK